MVASRVKCTAWTAAAMPSFSRRIVTGDIIFPPELGRGMNCGGFPAFLARRLLPSDASRTKIKPRRTFEHRGLWMRSLAVTFSGMACGHTTIGAERFHFRVRKGIGWFPLAIAARQTVSMIGPLLRAAHHRNPEVSRFDAVAFAMNHSIACI